jgi:flagellar biosynthetic protein FlhB
VAEEDREDDASSRTEEPTPQRLRRAAEEGQVALSREAVSFLALALAAGGGAALAPAGVEALLAALRGTLSRAEALPPAEAARHWLGLSLMLAAPVGALAALGAAAATLAQTRGAVSARALVPDLAKLSPLAGFGRLLGVEAWIEFGRTLVKVGVVGLALWWAADAAVLAASLHRPPGGLLAALGATALRMLALTLACFAVLAVLDLLLARFRHRQRLRMTRQELREEQKDTEGNPEIRAKRRAIMESKGRARMLAAVPKAKVVITNPTHYAVALAYEAGQSAAPKVVAKGVDAVAARIREVAQASGVPILSDPPLARALHRLELGAEIPAEHWEAVARMLAFVLRPRGGAG